MPNILWQLQKGSGRIRKGFCMQSTETYQENPALDEGKNQETIEQFSRHKFLDGLSAVDLQDRYSALNLPHLTNWSRQQKGTIPP